MAVKDGRAFRGHPKGLSLYGAFEVKHLFHGILHFLHSTAHGEVLHSIIVTNSRPSGLIQGGY